MTAPPPGGRAPARPPLPARTVAIALMCLTIFCFTVMDAVAKTLAQSLPTFQVVWARYVAQTAIAFLILAPRLGRLLRTRYLPLQIVRSAFLFAATMCFFFGIVAVGLAQSSAIMAANPLIITLLAVPVLGEQVGARRLAGVAAGFLGALIIIRPGTGVFTPASLLPLAAAFAYAGYALSTRFLGREESPWTSLLYTTLIGAAVASAFVPLVWVAPGPRELGLMAAMGAVGTLGHYCLIKALSLAEASILAPFAYTGPVWAAIWGVSLFDERLDPVTVLGALVIIGAGLYVWRREVAGRGRIR